VRREITPGDRLGARRAHRGEMFEVKRILRSAGTAAARSPTFWRCTGVGPMPLWLVRSGPVPCGTTRWRSSGSRSSPECATKLVAAA